MKSKSRVIIMILAVTMGILVPIFLLGVYSTPELHPTPTTSLYELQREISGAFGNFMTTCPTHCAILDISGKSFHILSTYPHYRSIREIPLPSPCKPRRQLASLHPSGEYLAVCIDQKLFIFDTDTGRQEKYHEPSSITSVQFDAAGTLWVHSLTKGGRLLRIQHPQKTILQTISAHTTTTKTFGHVWNLHHNALCVSDGSDQVLVWRLHQSGASTSGAPTNSYKHHMNYNLQLEKDGDGKAFVPLSLTVAEDASWVAAGNFSSTVNKQTFAGVVLLLTDKGERTVFATGTSQDGFGISLHAHRNNMLQIGRCQLHSSSSKPHAESRSSIFHRPSSTTNHWVKLTDLAVPYPAGRGFGISGSFVDNTIFHTVSHGKLFVLGKNASTIPPKKV